MRGDGGKETHIDEARVNMKEELEDREAREEACRSPAEPISDGVACAREGECTKKRMNDYLRCKGACCTRDWPVKQ